MNKKILLIATLVVLTIISIGSISAAEIDDEIVSDDAGEIELDNSINDDIISEDENPTIINISTWYFFIKLKILFIIITSLSKV